MTDRLAAHAPSLDDFDRLVRHVLVHEIAHHLGWSDDDIRSVDDWTE
jgi:predicted Zn-dependent protease with MMP-like domain